MRIRLWTACFFLSKWGKAEIAEQAVVDPLGKAVRVVAQLLGVLGVAEIGKLDQDRGHGGAPQYEQAGIQPDAIILGTDALDNADQDMLLSLIHILSLSSIQGHGPQF